MAKLTDEIDGVTIFVPRFGLTLSVSSVKQAITESIKELEYEYTRAYVARIVT